MVTRTNLQRRRRSPGSRAARDSAAITLLAPWVIHQRIAKLASTPYTARSRREAQRMVSEKLTAGTSSIAGVCIAMLRMQADLWQLYWRGNGMWPHATGVQRVQTVSAQHGARMASVALAPLARRVRANARRLAR